MMVDIITESVTKPWLENGDHLTRPEFEARYAQLPDVKKAELIEGVVCMSSPVRLKQHGRPHTIIMTWLGNYYAATPGVDVGDNVTVRLDWTNEVQPDALLRLERGQSGVDADDYVVGAPELIVEIAASSHSYDLHSKLKLYQRHGVQEYIVWAVTIQQLTWFRWHEGRYEIISPDAAGVIESTIFPGLRLDVTALLAGQAKQLLQTLQAGLASAAHAAFVKQYE